MGGKGQKTDDEGTVRDTEIRQRWAEETKQSEGRSEDQVDGITCSKGTEGD